MKEKMTKFFALLLLGTLALPLAGQTGAATEEQKPFVTDIEVTGKYKIRKEFAEIICAEITGSYKPELQNEKEQVDGSPYKDNTCWAQIILMLPEKRGLSRFDFELKYGNQVYPCMAVAVGDAPFSMSEDAWVLPEDRDAKEPVRMLFAVSKDRITGNNGSTLVKLNLELKYSEFTKKIGADVIRFRLVSEGKQLTTAADAKKFAEEKGGSYGMTEADLNPPKKEEKPEAAAAAQTAPASAPASAPAAAPAAEAAPKVEPKPEAKPEPKPAPKPAPDPNATSFITF